LAQKLNIYNYLTFKNLYVICPGEMANFLRGFNTTTHFVLELCEIIQLFYLA